ncbi:MAG TPA: YidC/Oxa1 family membrane protein insertase [Ktedonobacteraceae bacterium]|nr:YidC/Oxa1 family membrane protein insertase [Ktedonobacteraceae bacterium]
MSWLTDFINVVFTQPIFNALMLLYHLFGDFGLSIIVLTIFLRLILFPLTLQQLKSTKATQQLQPRMAELRKKHANDQQAQAQAMQALYKEYGINPLAGCLPLLIQMPILYGLFYALRAVLNDATLSVSARLASLNGFIYPFLPHFIHFPNINLDWFTFINHSWYFSLGNPDPTHVLPLLAGAATFIQMRMSLARNSGKAGDAMSQQMKMMQYLMPAITIFFGWSFPAGLALYWTTSSIFSMVQQYFVTGWGALLDTPLTSKASSSNGNGSGSSKKGSVEQQKASVIAAQGRDKEAAYAGEDGPVGSKLRNPSYQNGTSSARRARNSASARRRGNTPRRNPTRS